MKQAKKSRKINKINYKMACRIYYNIYHKINHRITKVALLAAFCNKQRYVSFGTKPGNETKDTFLKLSCQLKDSSNFYAFLRIFSNRLFRETNEGIMRKKREQFSFKIQHAMLMQETTHEKLKWN